MGEAQEVAWHDAGALSDLPEATPRRVRVGTTDVLLVRRGDTVHATDPLCPHKFADLEEATVEDGCLHCPVHDAAFHLGTGAPRDGDEWAGHLPWMPCRVDDGRILVRTTTRRRP